MLVPSGLPTSLGSGIIAMCAAGAFRTIEEAQTAMCLPHTTFQPDPAAVLIYQRLYSLYRQAYFALGTRTAESCSLGEVLPELRIVAAEARQKTN